MESTAEFFEGLAERGHVPSLEKASGTLRLDLVNGRTIERWLVTLDKGDVAVAPADGEDADCVVRVGRALFADIAAGRANGIAAMLRGALTVEGRYELLLLFQRLFPGPSEGRVKGREAGYARRRR